MKESELEEMLSALDLDGDGKVKMEDFLRLLVIPNNDNGSQTSESAEDQDKSLKRQYCIILWSRIILLVRQVRMECLWPWILFVLTHPISPTVSPVSDSVFKVPRIIVVKVWGIIIRTTIKFLIFVRSLWPKYWSLWKLMAIKWKRRISSIHWYLVLKNPAKGSPTAASQSPAVFLMVRIIITQTLD